MVHLADGGYSKWVWNISNPKYSFNSNTGGIADDLFKLKKAT
jgi:hypothetical protein